jgi:uncharacterized protein
MDVMIKKYSLIILFALVIGMNLSCADNNTDKRWSLPVDYCDILENAQKGDPQAQDTISKIIYKGIIRYPDKDKKEDVEFFAWLREINDNDSFEKKVARLFFTKGTSVDAQDTLKEIKVKAATGDPYAYRAMGSLYFYTDLVGVSSETGMKWYLKAAEQGHARAQMSLALRYLLGHHTPKNVDEGMKWLIKASDAELPEAQANLSNIYLEGKQFPKDINKAFDLLVSAAKGGDSASQALLASFHLDSLKIEFPMIKNPEEGVYWLEKSAKNGELQALLILGCVYIQGRYVKGDYQKGLALIKKSADLGNVMAKETYQKFIKLDEAS